MEPELKILYVLGRGRSGSTFVENALAERSGLALLGESRLWPRVYHDDHNCSCGAPKTKCPFWAPAIDTLVDQPTAKEAFQRTIRRSFLWTSILPAFLVKRIYAKEIAAIEAFYLHLAETHGLKQVIDSSKNPAFGRLLALAPRLNVTLLHVVRHPLGVAYSWKRQRSSGSKHKLHRQIKSVYRSTIEWTFSNLLSELAKLQVQGPHYTIAYEKLGTTDALDHIELQTSENGPIERHAMSGNPSAASRETGFRLDEAWRDGLTGFEKAACRVLSFPLDLLYRGKR